MTKSTAEKSKIKAGAKKKRGSRKPTFTEQARRKQILEVSSLLFRSKGFNRTSLEDIAREVGVSRGVIFYYFDGKRELAAQTVRQSLRQYSEYVQDRVSKKRTSKTELLEFIDACLDYQYDHREVYLLYADLVGCFGDADDRYALTIAANRATRAWLVEIIEAGQKSGEVTRVPVNDLADVVQGLIDGLMSMGALEPDVVNIDGCKRLIHKMVLKMIEPLN
jgi:AcrR family transcriptional regulator